MKIRIPHTLILLLGFMVLALVLTWLLPAGAFQMTEIAPGRSVVVPGTYAPLADRTYLPPWALLTTVPRAFAEAQGVIFFILLVGGVFGILRRTEAIEAGLGALMTRLRGRQTVLVLVATAIFALLSASFGMASEYLAFVTVIVALCAAMKLDAMVAAGVLLVGYGVGYGASTTNPFTVVVAQEIAGVPLGSGLWFRFIVLALAYAVGVHHILRYVRRAKAEPDRALAPQPQADGAEVGSFPPIDGGRKLVLALLALTIVVQMAGILIGHWRLPQLGGLFLGLGLAVALVGRIPGDEACQAFIEGASRLTGTALLVGFARAIGLILEDGQVLHTLVQVTSTPLAALPPAVSGVGMLGIQSFLNIFIPSGSGQAFATMPIMAPVADLVGISRQASVLAFQFGDGFTNLIIPTNPYLMAVLGLAGVSYGQWVRFVWPLMLKLMGLSAVAMIVAVQIGL